LEKFAGEAWLTFVVAGSMAVVLVPLAFLLNWNTPRTPVRGVPERWPGLYILLGSLLVVAVLPTTFSDITNRLGLFRFLDIANQPAHPLRPRISSDDTTEWTLITNSLRHNYSALAALPLILSSIWFLKKRRLLVAERQVARRSSWTVLVYEIILCWAVYGLLAITLNCVMQYLYLFSGWKPSIHPIAKVGIFDGTGGWIIGLGACVVAPFTEELIFRRWLLPWAMRKDYRVFAVQAVTVVMTGVAYNHVGRLEILLMGAVLLAIQAAWYALRTKLSRVHRCFRSRTFAANWAVSSLFAMLHGTVWPSPIALLVLSMGLGFLVVRTGRWWTAFLCHALFNLTSLMVLYASQGAFGPTFKIAVP
jgi:membrane protease YdiL (CAAX protease family)